MNATTHPNAAPARPAGSTNFSQPYWDAAADGRLLLQFCLKSGQYQHYPRPVSIHDGSRDLEWRPVSGKGKVYTYTVTRKGPPEFRGKEPYVVAIIELDEGVRFVANLVHCDPAAVAIDMRVRSTWQRLPDGNNLLQFEPDVDA